MARKEQIETLRIRDSEQDTEIEKLKAEIEACMKKCENCEADRADLRMQLRELEREITKMLLKNPK